MIRCGHCGQVMGRVKSFTTKEAAAWADCCEQTVINWCETGQIEFYRAHNRGWRRIPKIPFLNFLAESGHEMARKELAAMKSDSGGRAG